MERPIIGHRPDFIATARDGSCLPEQPIREVAMAGDRRPNDTALGMDRPIERRDFLNGMAVAIGAIGAGLAGMGSAAAQGRSGSPGAGSTAAQEAAQRAEGS